MRRRRTEGLLSCYYKRPYWCISIPCYTSFLAGTACRWLMDNRCGATVPNHFSKPCPRNLSGKMPGPKYCYQYMYGAGQPKLTWSKDLLVQRIWSIHRLLGNMGQLPLWKHPTYVQQFGCCGCNCTERHCLELY